MKKLILVRGPLGVGKTTVARKLAASLNAHYISIDSVLEENHLDQAEEDGIPVKNFIKGNELVLPEIRSALEKGKPVIIDGCFYHKEQIEHFIQNLDAPCFVFTLKAPLEVCIERDKGREKSYGEGAAWAVHGMVSKFDYGTGVITEDKTPEETMEEIESNLGRKFSTIFWDSDGTLVDTEPPYFKVTQTVLKEVGIDLTRDWYVNEQLKKGTSAFDLARDLGQSEASIQALREKKDELYLESLKTGVQVMRGVVTTLNALHGKVPMAIVTTSRKVNFEQIMTATGLAKYFDFFIVREDVVHEKPDPEPYLKAWEKSGLPKEKCLVIEDTERGVISAKAAGLTCFAIPNELSKDNDFSKADGIIKNLVEILEFI